MTEESPIHVLRKRDIGVTYPTSLPTRSDVDARYFDSTGLLSGGALSINGGDNTKFDISEAMVSHVDYSAPDHPVKTRWAMGPYTALTVDDIGTQLVTYIGLDPINNLVIQQGSPFSNDQRRNIVSLGLLVHSNLTNLNAINTIAGTVQSGINQFQDYLEFRGPLKTGIEFAPNGANLNLNRSAGDIFKFGSNFQADPDNPHIVAVSGQTALTFRYRTQDAEPAGDVTAIDPGTYDVAGTLTAVPSNDWTVQHITVFQSGLTRIQYGQNTYAQFADALANYQSETFVTEQNIADNGIFCCYLIVKEGATDLSDPSEARFINTTAAGVPSSPSVPLASTDDLAEGVTNLYFTDARARDAMSPPLTIDTANNRIGINTTTPERPVHIVGVSGEVASFPSGPGAATSLIIENNGNSSLSTVFAAGSSSSFSGYTSGAASSSFAFTYNDSLGAWQFAVGATLPFTLLSTGKARLSLAIERTGVISPAQITANQTGYNPTGLSTASVLRLDLDADRTINSLVVPSGGTELLIFNRSAFNLSLLHDDGATGTASERFLCPGNVNYVIPRNGGVKIWNDTASSRWRIVGI